MTRRTSLSHRAFIEGEYSGDYEIFLLYVEHPGWAEPARITFDPTERITTDPLTYGTRSSWQSDDGSPFLYIGASIEAPGDMANAPGASQITIYTFDSDLLRRAKSVTTPPTVHLAIVMASDLDTPVAEWRDFQLRAINYGPGYLTLSTSRDAVELEELAPKDTMTPRHLPGIQK